ncbi:MAG: hypothetical protein BAJALOKI1v1_1460004 [Promethearchaeota archaeon]|nr:MAG: hypothetical protein BAJALOKI1v1_1460004 [Candidatus Lokiarchaeota archaeon]
MLPENRIEKKSQITPKKPMPTKKLAKLKILSNLASDLFPFMIKKTLNTSPMRITISALSPSIHPLIFNILFHLSCFPIIEKLTCFSIK